MPSVADELETRLRVWEEIRSLHDGGALDAAAVNMSRADGIRVFYGGRGIWTDKARTSTLATDGVTVGVLHTGRTYADDLLPDGIVYHYPRTSVPGRDQQEVNATKAARDLGLPLFVVVQPDSTSRRIAHLGWVEEWDDQTELFAISFGDNPPAPLPTRAEEDAEPFLLERAGDGRKRTQATARPGQHRFSFRVFRRYGAKCSVCDVSVLGLLDAAHLRGYAERGSDDPRNGLVLCATHHRAFDKRLFAIDPLSLALVFRTHGPDAAALGITRTSIAHLLSRPHLDSLTWCWSRFGGDANIDRTI